MFAQLIKQVIALVLVMHIPHKLVYAALAVLYACTCFGLDKALVNPAVAFGYAMLAVERS